MVSNDGYRENYKRLYFADITALVLRHTNSGSVRRYILGAFAAIAGMLCLLGAAEDWPLAVSAPLGTAAGLLLIFLVSDILRGPTCDAYVHTAVQTQQLRPLRRLRGARKAFAELAALVSATQGGLDVEQAEALYRDALERAAAERAERASTPRGKPAPEARPVPPGASRPPLHRNGARRYVSHVHLLLFSALLADAAHSALSILLAGRTMFVLGLLLAGGIITLVACALVKQHDTDLSRPVRAVTWVTAGYIGAGYFFGVLLTVIGALSGVSPSVGPWAAIRAWTRQGAMDSPIVMGLVLFSLLGSGALGLIGLLTLRRHRAARARPPALKTMGTG